MNVSVDVLAEEIVRLLTIEMEASGRHIHLSRAHVDALFGVGYKLTPVKDLSQPGQFACKERVTLVGAKGELKNVVVLGPERGESQVEISLTDAVALGITPPVRQSGDLPGTPGLTVRNGERMITLDHGLIAAQRHIHMTPEDAARWGVSDNQTIRLKPSLPVRWSLMTWWCGCPPSSERWFIWTTTRPMRAGLRGVTGA